MLKTKRSSKKRIEKLKTKLLFTIVDFCEIEPNCSNLEINKALAELLNNNLLKEFHGVND